ncbi:minor capsid protein [uncultured Enterococcus sp.]|uniref:phage tail terminator protein n=1 Tax=uncultured Enterococcus sp. TaxID=167972 RepID=UPI002AA91D5B|nr:minor capsid protein [uncultured Enterococcus sp.]
MDFLERLVDEINSNNELAVECSIGYLEKSQSFVIYPMAGSRVINEFYDGIKDQALNYQFAFKSKDQQLTNEVLWKVHKIVESIETLESVDGSFKFDEIRIIDTPFINQFDETGYFVFLLTIQAKITTF